MGWDSALDEKAEALAQVPSPEDFTGEAAGGGVRGQFVSD